MSAYLWEETGKAGTISYKLWKVRVQEVRLLCMGFFAPFLAEPHQLSMCPAILKAERRKYGRR